MFPLVAMLFLVAADRSAGCDVGRDVGVLEVVTIYGMGPARALLLPVMTDIAPVVAWLPHAPPKCAQLLA